MSDNEEFTVTVNAAQAVADEITSSIKDLIGVDEDEYHDLTDEKRFDEADIALAFISGVIKASTLGDMLTPQFVGEVAVKIAGKLGFIPSETQEDNQ